MRKYTCHKTVEAGQISKVECRDASDSILITVGGDVFDLPSSFIARGAPTEGDYLVRYEPDGYLSWSPQGVFEAGYTLVEKQ